MRFTSLLLLSVLPATLACRFAPDTRPLQTRLESVPLAFVGTVSSVHEGMATFTVEQPLRGTPGREVRVPIGQGSCDIRFRAGDRWLYAGATVPDPSLRLGDAAAPLGRAMSRLNDDRLGLEQWQRCDDSRECVEVHYDCSVTAANREHQQRATERAWAIGGDPRTQNCTAPSSADRLSACVGQRCGIWRFRPYP